MGCVQSHATDDNEFVETKGCSRFVRIKAAKRKQAELDWKDQSCSEPPAGDSGNTAALETIIDEQPVERALWESCLAPLAAALEAEEQARPALWWRSSASFCVEAADETAQKSAASAWDALYTELQDKPLEEVLRRLPALGARPWQCMWRRSAQTFGAAGAVLADALSEASGLRGDSSGSTWEDACELLRQTAGGQVSFRDLLLQQVPQGLQADALHAELTARKQLLLLQEQLSWLARVVSSALAVGRLQQGLLDAISKDTVEAGAGDLAKTDAASIAPSPRSLWSFALAGFRFQGVLFRVIIDDDEWQTVSAEVRQAQRSIESGSGARLLVAVEGLGLRLVASPALPFQEPEPPPTALDARSLCTRWLLEHLRQLGVAAPSDGEELLRWCAWLPNPRGLLSLEVPLVAAMRVSRSTLACPSRQPMGGSSSLCLSLVFGLAEGDLTAARCGQPEIIAGASLEDTLGKVAGLLGCAQPQLQRFEGPNRLFGCACEVWFCPEHCLDSSKLTDSTPEQSFASSGCIWDWRSDRFAVLFEGMATRPPLPVGRSGAGAWAAAAKAEDRSDIVAADSSLAGRLAAAAQQLASRPVSVLQPQVLRGMLKAHGVPVRLTCGLAEPRLVGADTEAGFLEEPVGVELLATAAKHTVRHLLARRSSEVEELPSPGALSARNAPQGASKVFPSFSVERGWAVDSPASLELQTGGVAAPDEGTRIPVVHEAAIVASWTEADAEKALAGSGRGSRQDHDQFHVVDVESPIPPLQPLRTPGLRAASSQPLEIEAELLVGALQVHPEFGRSSMERLAAIRLGLLQAAFWVRLVAAAWELQVWWPDELHSSANVDGKEQEATSACTTASSLGPGQAPVEEPLEGLLKRLGRRLLFAARGSPRSLLRSMAVQLRLEIAKDVLRRLRVATGSGLGNLPMRLPAPEVPAEPGVADWRGGLVLRAHLRAKGPVSHEDTLVEALAGGLAACEGTASRGSASARLAAQLLAGSDLSLIGRWSRRGNGGLASIGLGQRMREPVPLRALAQSSGSPFPQPEQVSPSTAMGLASGVAACEAVLASSSDQDHCSFRRRVQKVKGLLRFTQWLLLAAQSESHQSTTAAGNPRQGEPNSQQPVLSAASQALQAAAALLGELGGSCPPELLASLWTLRGYICEKQGDADSCYLQYLQALSVVDETWGDPRRAGCRGHPFALLLVWKLGLISYCRSDLKSIEKFGDYFRALVIASGGTSPFSWGPASLPEGERTGLDDEHAVLHVLWQSEARLWRKDSACGFWAWWQHNDILDFGDEACPHPLMTLVPNSAKKERQATSAAIEGIVGDKQEVWRGTVFSFGSNELGQLGIGSTIASGPALKPGSAHTGGADLSWSGSPVRLVSLKGCRIQEIACGESHNLAIDTEGQLYAWGCINPGHGEEVAVSGGNSKNPSPRNSPRMSPRGGTRSLSASPPTSGYHRLTCYPQRVLRYDGFGTVRFAAIACGAQFSVALDSNGRIWSWGSGEGGVLGLGTSGISGRTVPARLALLPSSKLAPDQPLAVKKEVGEEDKRHKVLDMLQEQRLPDLDILGSTAAAQSSSAPSNANLMASLDGELGRLDDILDHASSTSSEVPCKTVACGSYHAMAISSEGVLYSWGRAEGGQLGLTETEVNSHIEKNSLDDTCVCEPLMVGFLANGDGSNGGGPSEQVRLQQVAGGDVHSLALDVSGQVWAWGWGEFGQLGLGFSAASFEVGHGGMASKRLTPEAIPASCFGTPCAVSAIACGGAFSAAIVDSGNNVGGRLYLWGANEVGQCGLSAKQPAEVEVPSEVPALRHAQIRSVACGASHVVAIDVNGQAYSWGSSQFGQLGRTDPPRSWAEPPGAGEADANPLPIPSLARLRIMRAACGLHHTLLVSEVYKKLPPAFVEGRSAQETNLGKGAVGPNGLPVVAV